MGVGLVMPEMACSTGRTFCGSEPNAFRPFWVGLRRQRHPHGRCLFDKLRGAASSLFTLRSTRLYGKNKHKQLWSTVLQLLPLLFILWSVVARQLIRGPSDNLAWLRSWAIRALCHERIPLWRSLRPASVATDKHLPITKALNSVPLRNFLYSNLKKTVVFFFTYMCFFKGLHCGFLVYFVFLSYRSCI